MTTEDNSNNSTMPENTSHYYTPDGKLIVTDPIKYFHESFDAREVYSLRLYDLMQDKATFRVSYAARQAGETAEFQQEQVDTFWSYILENQNMLEDKYDIDFEVRDRNTTQSPYRTLTMTRKSRISAEHMIEEGGITQEAYDFIQTAYQSGVNIVVSGVTFSGKTRFLNVLMDSSKDYKPTVLVNSFPEMLFGFDQTKIINLSSEKPSSLVRNAVSMNPSRVVMDDVFLDSDLMKDVIKASKGGMQFVGIGHCTGPEQFAERAASHEAEDPFEINVYVKMNKTVEDGTTKYRAAVSDIEQIIHQKIGSKYSMTGRLLFTDGKKVAEPTRTLRRKMEANNPAAYPAASTGEESAVHTFVALTPKEKAELIDHRAALQRHFAEQSFVLQERFKAIDKILAKF